MLWEMSFLVLSVLCSVCFSYLYSYAPLWFGELSSTSLFDLSRWPGGFSSPLFIPVIWGEWTFRGIYSPCVFPFNLSSFRILCLRGPEPLLWIQVCSLCLLLNPFYLEGFPLSFVFGLFSFQGPSYLQLEFFSVFLSLSWLQLSNPKLSSSCLYIVFAIILALTVILLFNEVFVGVFFKLLRVLW